jgi:hypothetical protein
MLILFDHGTPRGISCSRPPYRKGSASPGWDTLKNGELLKAAEDAGSGVLLTTDKNRPYQQNLAGRKIAVVVLGKARWRLIKPMLAQIVAAIEAAKPGTCSVVEIPNLGRSK